MEDFPSLDSPAIIALKGLPITFKTSIARNIAKVSRTPVLFIEDFLAHEAAPQSKEEALHRAFDVLCKVAEEQARSSKVNYVVIKSRLCSTFEFDRLIELMINSEFYALLIIECRCNSEYWRQLRLDRYIHNVPWKWYDHISWYNPNTWNEVEMANDDYNAQAWEDHFDYSISQLPTQHFVKRLIIDVASAQVSIWEADDQTSSKNTFFDVIRYLLKEEAMVELPYTVEFDEVRRSILEQELQELKAKERSEYLCNSECGCIFEYREALECDSCCGVCEKPVSGSVYACYCCILVLHKSCAEEPKMVGISNPTPYWDYLEEYRHLPKQQYYIFDEKHACHFCKKSGKSFSYSCKSCLFQTHLKCRVVPTIVYHACHSKHFLSIWIKPGNPIVEGTAKRWCKGCDTNCVFNGYVCVSCNYNYHIRCIAAPGETKHEHGGHEHVMKLWYSYDDMEEEEDFWCDVCNEDIDPNDWFYRCNECPYYVSHMDMNNRMPCKGSM